MIYFIKIFLILRFAYCIYSYHIGKLSGANLKDLITEIGYLCFTIYILIRFESFVGMNLYLDILLVVAGLISLKDILQTLKLYFLAKDFGINPENRIACFADFYLKGKQHDKVYRILKGHMNIVKNSGKLLIYMGNACKQQKLFEEAYACFVEATNNTKDEDLLITAATNGFLVCSQELNDYDSAKEFVDNQIIRDISSRHIVELEKLIKK